MAGTWSQSVSVWSMAFSKKIVQGGKALYIWKSAEYCNVTLMRCEIRGLFPVVYQVYDIFAKISAVN